VGVDGCQEWQLLGLNPPEHVKGATRDYLKSEDAFKAWLDEACDQGGQSSPRSDALWRRCPNGFHANANPNAWRHWAEARNFDPRNIKVFGRWLTKEFGPSERRITEQCADTRG
jgi:phage/plasmid-associated DNA primase